MRLVHHAALLPPRAGGRAAAPDRVSADAGFRRRTAVNLLARSLRLCLVESVARHEGQRRHHPRRPACRSGWLAARRSAGYDALRRPADVDGRRAQAGARVVDPDRQPHRSAAARRRDGSARVAWLQTRWRGVQDLRRVHRPARAGVRRGDRRARARDRGHAPDVRSAQQIPCCQRGAAADRRVSPLRVPGTAQRYGAHESGCADSGTLVGDGATVRYNLPLRDDAIMGDCLFYSPSMALANVRVARSRAPRPTRNTSPATALATPSWRAGRSAAL